MISERAHSEIFFKFNVVKFNGGKKCQKETKGRTCEVVQLHIVCSTEETRALPIPKENEFVLCNNVNSFRLAPWKSSTQENNYLCEGPKKLCSLVQGDIPRHRLGEGLQFLKRS